uniref:C2H2-type domain-containing protein n=1 Tax=Schizaphis graminum TaxID=13262 RepID=A0A2S2NZF8_SCHGA
MMKTEESSNDRNHTSIINENTTATAMWSVKKYEDIKIEDTDLNEVNSEQGNIVIRNLAEHVDNQYTENVCSSSIDMQSSSTSNSISNVCNYINLRTTKISTQNNRNMNNSIQLVKTVSNNSSQKCCSTSKSNSTIFLQECKPFKCVDCIFSTKSETKFMNHSYVCEGNSLSSSSLQKSKCIQNPSLIKKHKCKYCNNTFITPQKLHIHYKQHEQNLKCIKCNKRFLLKKSFEKHLLLQHNISSI